MLRHNNTHFEIAYWAPKYILYRGTKKFAELGVMSPTMRRIAQSQDVIGWRNFMEGRISKQFYNLQHLHLVTSSSQLNAGDWMKHFISRVIQLTHSQWIYRNFVLHDRKRGYLRLKERDQLLLDLAVLMWRVAMHQLQWVNTALAQHLVSNSEIFINHKRAPI